MDHRHDYFFNVWREAIEKVKDSFAEAQLNQKKYYDQKTVEREFQVGDVIVLRDMRLRSKFEPRWLGPYTVTRKMGKLNYAIRMPERNRQSYETSTTTQKSERSATLADGREIRNS